MKPNIIIEKVKEFGIIKYFRSMKKIIKKDKPKTIKNTVVNEMPNKK